MQRHAVRVMRKRYNSTYRTVYQFRIVQHRPLLQRRRGFNGSRVQCSVRGGGALAGQGAWAALQIAPRNRISSHQKQTALHPACLCHIISYHPRSEAPALLRSPLTPPPTVTSTPRFTCGAASRRPSSREIGASSDFVIIPAWKGRFSSRAAFRALSRSESLGSVRLG